MFKNEPDLLTRKQCQNLLHISKSKMLEYIQDGYIPAIIIAGSYLIKKRDLIEFIENSTHYNVSAYEIILTKVSCYRI